ncbi:GGDEF domain-containing protein [Halothiobacillus sp. DCM-1]|uniref:GGDEF domain-containing protein n=1 Tax=Halothiobacillus sp. DCM-1 TaxID=3112558 RepID=UPI00325072D9
MAAYRSNVDDALVDGRGYRLRSPVVARSAAKLIDTTELRLSLMAVAQRYMDPASLLNAVFELLSNTLPITGFSWVQNHSVVATPGFTAEAHHRVLKFHDAEQLLGELQVQVVPDLTEQEWRWLEQMIQSVALALRNTTIFQDALQAAQRDPLTGLENRRAFDGEIAREQAQFMRYGQVSSLVVMDLNGFKAINDTWGHDVGDRLLAHFASGLRVIVRETDHVYRFGGDEFCVLLPGTGHYGAKKMTARMDAWLDHHELTLPSGERVRVRTSYGCATTEKEGDCRTWFRRADQDLYQNKRARRSCAA